MCAMHVEPLANNWSDACPPDLPDGTELPAHAAAHRNAPTRMSAVIVAFLKLVRAVSRSLSCHATAPTRMRVMQAHRIK
jgi:hypothetical protein